MDLLHKFLNIALPLLMIIAFTFFLPPFLLLKFISFLKRSINSENVYENVVLITGASSEIGEHVAYEYARRGAILALVARREDHLRKVAYKARELGSPEVIVICADISKDEECKQFVDETVNHFGRLDHLVNNAGVSRVDFFEDSTDIASIMDVNFWGSASKAALISFFETLRTEIGPNIGITIVTPGLIGSEMTQRPFSTNTSLCFQCNYLVQGNISWMPIESTERCAKAIVDSTCRGDMYLTVPSWMGWGFWMRVFCPEILEWCLHTILVKWPHAQKDS
ncbi:hypothetical protein ACJW31_04G163000 [Castanea mollissima]